MQFGRNFKEYDTCVFFKKIKKKQNKKLLSLEKNVSNHFYLLHSANWYRTDSNASQLYTPLFFNKKMDCQVQT